MSNVDKTSLSPEEKEKAFNHINKTVNPKECAFCGVKDWVVTDKVFNLITGIGGPVFPVITVCCANCGNTILINAVVIGVIESFDKSEEKENSNGR